jgi:hypothetical protein
VPFSSLPVVVRIVPRFSSPHTASTNRCRVNCTGASPSLINSSADAEALGQQCQTLNNLLLIEPSATGAISLDGLGSLPVSLNCYDANQITSISSNSLRSVGYWFDIENLSSLITLSFPKLESIGQTLNIVNTPALERLQLAYGASAGAIYTGSAASLTNITNTGLAEIEGWMNATTHDIWIGYNRNLRTVNLLVYQVLRYSSGAWGDLFIMNNGQTVNVSLPNLFSVGGTFTIGNCSELSIPSLTLVDGSMEMINAHFSSLSAPSLVRINGDLNITGAFSGYD